MSVLTAVSGLSPRERSPWAVRRTITRLDELAGPIRGWLLLVAATSAVVGVLEALILFIVATVAASLTSLSIEAATFGPVDLHDVSRSSLLWIGAGLTAVDLGLQLVSGWGIATMTTRGVHTARMRLIRSHSRSTWPAKEALTDSALIQLAHSNVSKVGEGLVATGSLISSLANFVALVVSAFVIDPVAALAMLLGVGFLLGVISPLSRAARGQQRDLVQLNRSYTASLQVYAGLGREIEVFGVQAESVKAIEGYSHRLGRVLRRARLTSTASTALFKCAALGLILALLAAVSLIGTGQVAALAAISLVLLRSVSYGQSVQSGLHSLAESSSWIDDLSARIGELTASQSVPGTEPLVGHPVRRGLCLALEGVDFRYGEATSVFTDLSLSIGAGEYVGLAGPSGAGKTTLAELLLGLRPPTGGRVTVDGQDLAAVDRAAWARVTAFVPQEPVLASGTLADNVRFYRPWFTDEEVQQALVAAGVLTDAQEWSDGIATEVGALGGKLSGGQRQRIAIARALIGQPELLVLDEPTSALDEVSERRVAAALDEIRGSVTVVVIAHRLSTLERCDRVIVLAGGNVNADGPPSGLGDLSRFLEAEG